MAAEDVNEIVQPTDVGSDRTPHLPIVPADGSPTDEYMPIGEANRHLRMPEQAIKFYLKKGLLEGKREGGAWMVSRNSIRRFSDLLAGSDEGYAWLFQDYNKLLNNYLELIRENNQLSEQVGFLKAKEQFLVEYKNSLEAKEREVESLKKALARAERISRAIQAVAEQLEERSTSLANSHPEENVQEIPVGGEEATHASGDANEGRVAGEAQPVEADDDRREGGEEALESPFAVSEEKLTEFVSENQQLTSRINALSDELGRMKDRNEELLQELARLYGELNEWRNMSFWRRIFVGKIQ